MSQKKSASPVENPKAAFGRKKLPLSLWPDTATLMGCLAMFDGGSKYGLNNYLATPIVLSDYLDALARHVADFKAGQWLDPKSKQPHLGHALANLAIVVEAWANGNLVDDRPYSGGYLRLAELMVPSVAAITEAHRGKDPRHYYLSDSGPPAGEPWPQTLEAMLRAAAEPAPPPKSEGPAWNGHETRPPPRGPIVVRFPAEGDGRYGDFEERTLGDRGAWFDCHFRPGAQWRFLTAEEYLAWANSDD